MMNFIYKRPNRIVKALTMILFAISFVKLSSLKEIVVYKIVKKIYPGSLYVKENRHAYTRFNLFLINDRGLLLISF